MAAIFPDTSEFAVAGVIGTSPLYTEQTVFSPGDPHPVKVSTENIFEVVSLIFRVGAGVAWLGRSHACGLGGMPSPRCGNAEPSA